MKPGRNDPCPCGSGKKYKKCCQDKFEVPSAFQPLRQQAEVAMPKYSVKGTAPTPDEMNQLAALFNAGRHIELESRARLLVESYPDSGLAWKILGASLQVQGKDALPALKKATALLPDDADAHNNLGNALQVLGQLDDAVASLRRALEIKPDYAHAYFNLGNALNGLGQLEKAVVSYRRALEIKPDFTEAHSNLGSALNNLGQIDNAVASYRRALEIKPDYAEVHNNLGNALNALGQLDDAVKSYRRALEIKPDYAEAHNNLGNALKALGQLDDAVKSSRRALEIKPDYAEAHSNLGNALKDLGQLDAAVASYRRALEIKPDFAEAHNNMGNALRELGQFDDAVASCRRALEIKPDYAEAHNNMGNVLLGLGRPSEAEASYRRALEIKPDNATAHSNLGSALKDLMQLGDAAASYRRALAIKPDLAEVYSNLLFCLSQSEAVGAQALFAEHCRFAEQFEASLCANWPQHSNSPDPERPLRIGFVSADLRNHAVASFIEPVLEHLAKHPQLSLHAYSNHGVEDAVAQRLLGYLTHWAQIVGLSDDALAEKIRADGIDILIDLSGHSAKNRLQTFARKPAPVQASWMGFPGTTGLSAMDYYLADRFFLPPGHFDSQFTEKIVQMPASAPFLPSKEAPLVNLLPALSNGYITFGSFNRPTKFNHTVIALWSQILRALPDSRMVLGGMPKQGNYDTLIEWFAQEGIVRERLDFHPLCGMGRYLSLHHQVDICLDTFPYNGGTTTCHALWMGVPTLTLVGSTAAGRPGACLLGHAGLEAFVAHDAADFVQKGLYWAGNLAELANIRAGLRERFAKSAMGQPAVVAAGVERALRIMWQRWCAGLPTESFEVSLQDISSTMPEAGK